MDQTREDEIVRDVLRGDVQAFGLLVRRYQGPVYGLMLRKTRDVEDAADLAQEAFAKAYAKLDRFKVGERFFPWLYALSLNVHRDWCRAKQRDRQVSVPNIDALADVDGSMDFRDELQGRLDGRKVVQAIMKLDEKYREVLILRYRHDQSMQEIALAMSITVSAAKMRIKRGLEMIRGQFKEDANGQ